MGELERAFKRAIAHINDNRGFPAVLGRANGDILFVDAAGVTHKNLVWVRVEDSSEEFVARCTRVALQYDTPVRVDNVNGVPTVLGLDEQRAVEFTGGRPGGETGPHGWTHQRLGPDPLYVTGLQVLPLMAHPTQPPSLSVTVEQASYRYASTEKIFETASISLSSYVPTGSDDHFVIVALDRANNALVVVDGTDVPATTDALGLGTVGVTPADVVAITMNSAYWPICVVELYTGQTQIKAKDIAFDHRYWAGDGGGAASLPVVDTTEIVRGSADATKRIRFEVDGITTGTTRVITIPDKNATIAAKEGETFTGAVAIQGSADAVQMEVKGNATQTNPIYRARKSDNTDLATISNAGQLALPIQGTAGGILLGGDVPIWRSGAARVSISDIIRGRKDVAAAANIIELYNANTSALNGTQFSFMTDTTGAGASSEVNMVQFRGLFAEHNHATAAAALQILVMRNGSLDIKLRLADGLQIGNPTGGDKGLGTINTQGDIYKNNTAYTNPDYALEYWATGIIDRFSDRPGAQNYRRLTLGEVEAFIRENLHLPGISRDAAGIFDRSDMLLEKVEELYTHVIELGHKVSALTKRVSELERGQ